MELQPGDASDCEAFNSSACPEKEAEKIGMDTACGRTATVKWRGAEYFATGLTVVSP
jgi:hypothetical protein